MYMYSNSCALFAVDMVIISMVMMVKVYTAYEQGLLLLRTAGFSLQWCDITIQFCDLQYGKCFFNVFFIEVRQCLV